MNYSREQINQLQQIPITTYLASMGITPIRESNGQLLYCSPLSEERTPSFYVHPQKNVFNCFSSGQKGDVIRLVGLIEKLNFKPVLERLAGFDPNQSPTFSFSGLKPLNSTPTSIAHTGPVLLEERAICNTRLMKYVVGRGISATVAHQYLFYLRYQNGNREYFAVGFKTDKESYALRAPNFKSWLGASAIRTLYVPGSTEIDVFEGYFDFLSFLTYYNQLRPLHTTVVLNSTSNLSQAIPAFQTAQHINCYLDNDKAGYAVIAKLNALHLPVRNCSGIYAGHKDFNEFLTNARVIAIK